MQKFIRGLRDTNDEKIETMNSSWITKTYTFGNYIHLCIHLAWSDISPVGTLYLDYSGSGEDEWEVFNTIVIDGTKTSQMFLDANLAVAAFRLRFVHASGGADLSSFVVMKGEK